MKSTYTLLGVILVILLIALGTWHYVRSTQGLTLGDPTVATSTEGTTATASSTNTTGTTGGTVNSTSGLKETYTNATYGFTISYPRELNAEPFGNFHLLNQNDWRYGGNETYRGTPVISVPVIHIDNESKKVKSYPLYYGAEVRVGVSTDTKNCYVPDDGYDKQNITNVTMNGVTWKKFVFSDAAMMQYIAGASYRTVHNNKCYVIEQIENGSHYKDETMVGGYTDADLKAIYNKTTPIVQSFKFTK